MVNKNIHDREIRISPEASASAHDDGIVILDSRRGRMFSSNLAGKCIWRSIEQRMSFEGVVEALGSEFQIARATAREHAALFLAALERHTLIERRANG
jgi:hypothetical protein